MKRAVLTVLLIVALGLCAGCSRTGLGEASPYGELPSSHTSDSVDMEYTVTEQSEDGIVVTIANKLSGGEWAIGIEYTIEKSVGGTWYAVPLKNGGVFPEYALSLTEPSYPFEVSFDDLDYEMDEGTYRFVKYAGSEADGSVVVLAAQFEYPKK